VVVTNAGQAAVASDGTVLLSWPPHVAAFMAALVGTGRTVVAQKNGGLPSDVEQAFLEFARAVHASRHASRGEVTDSGQLRDGEDSHPRSSPSPTVTVQEAAKMLNISESTVLRRRKQYGAERVRDGGRQWLLSRVLVDADVRRPA